MGLISQSLPSLSNGVSQQPYHIRLPSQAEMQTNGLSSLTDGVGKRPPSQHLARLFDTVSNAFVHWINRDDTERYVVTSDGSKVRVFGLDGTEYPVVNHGLTPYLSCPDPVNELRAVTIADSTVLVNTTMATAMRSDLSPTPPPGAVVWVKQANYNTAYNIILNNTKVTYTTPDGVNDGDAGTQDEIFHTQINTIVSGGTRPGREGAPGAEAIGLLQLLYRNFGNRDWLFTAYEGVIYIRRTDGKDFSIAVSDSANNSMIACVKDSVQRFTDLPQWAAHDFVVMVSGDPSSDSDDYWVRFVRQNRPNDNSPDTLVDFAFAGIADVGPGLWEETLEPGIKLGFDPATMPILLNRKQAPVGGATFRDADNSTVPVPSLGIYFELAQPEWGDRISGSEDTSPEPSFIGSTLSDVFLHRGRMGFLSSTNVLLSVVGDFFNFWRGTVQTVLDDDPIDVTAATPQVLNLRHALPLSEELILFSDRCQQVLSASDLLTPKTVYITTASVFECDPVCSPVGVDSTVYFPFQNGDYSGMTEYYSQYQTRQKDGQAITAHVPRYIPGRVFKIAASSPETTLVCLCDGKRGSAFVYRWFYNGQDKVQSSWSEWDFGTASTLLSVFFIGPDLYTVIVRHDGTFLEKVPLNHRADDGVDWMVTVDRLITEEDAVAVEYNATTGTTRFTLPWYWETDVAVVTRYNPSIPSYVPGRILTRANLSPDDVLSGGGSVTAPSGGGSGTGSAPATVTVHLTVVGDAGFPAEEGSHSAVLVSDGMLPPSYSFGGGTGGFSYTLAYSSTGLHTGPGWYLHVSSPANSAWEMNFFLGTDDTNPIGAFLYLDDSTDWTMPDSTLTVS